MTVIDLVTNLVEIYCIPDKTAKESFKAFERSWLCQYPHPVRCLHDNGSEFTGHDFQLPLEQAGIKSKNITSLNPQSNRICEQSHVTIGQILRTLVHLRPPSNAVEAANLMDDSPLLIPEWHPWGPPGIAGTCSNRGWMDGRS